MKILRKVYSQILNEIPDYSFETGGILGGRDGVIEKFMFDKGLHQLEQRCCYVPDTIMINQRIEDWSYDQVDFYGIWHTHFGGSINLSKGDIKYIKNILCAVYPEKRGLYFPIILIPERKIEAYYCILCDQEIQIKKENIRIV